MINWVNSMVELLYQDYENATKYYKNSGDPDFSGFRFALKER